MSCMFDCTVLLWPNLIIDKKPDNGQLEENNSLPVGPI